MGRCTVSLKLIKSTGVHVMRFDMGLDYHPVGSFECPECKSVVSLKDLRFSFRFVEGFNTAVYQIKTICLRCRDSGL